MKQLSLLGNRLNSNARNKRRTIGICFLRGPCRYIVSMTCSWTEFKMKMFATFDKARPDTENIRGSNLAAVMCTTVQVSKAAVID
jgi:hypothetical protein